VVLNEFPEISLVVNFLITCFEVIVPPSFKHTYKLKSSEIEIPLTEFEIIPSERLPQDFKFEYRLNTMIVYRNLTIPLDISLLNPSPDFIQPELISNFRLKVQSDERRYLGL
jgi:hypothetical protein